MTQLVYLNVLISLYEFNIWLDGYIWWKFCVNSPLRNPLTDKNADVSNTYFPRCICVYVCVCFNDYLLITFALPWKRGAG